MYVCECESETDWLLKGPFLPGVLTTILDVFGDSTSRFLHFAGLEDILMVLECVEYFSLSDAIQLGVSCSLLLHELRSVVSSSAAIF
jgi:hypothetical protein